MDYGFDRSGAIVAVSDASCVYVLSVLEDRSTIRMNREGAGSSSMYQFGGIICWALRTGFDWKPLLSLIPEPGSSEKEELREKLLASWDLAQSFVLEEIVVPDFSREMFDELVEVFCRLYPSYGHFNDSMVFLSDNFYSFDPTWNYSGYQSAPDFRSMVQEAFGFYRRDLARAVSKSKGTAIAFLSIFRNSLTQEQIIELLSGELLEGCTDWGFMGAELEADTVDLSAFNLLPAGTRYSLVKDLIVQLSTGGRDSEFETAAILKDTLNMLGSIGESELRRFRSDRNWDQAHRRAAGLASVEIERLEPVSFPSELIDLDGREILPELWLTLLRTPAEFLMAGSTSALNNCMGKAGYYTKAKRGESYCFTAFSPEGIAAGIELEKVEDGWKVLQLRGPSNGELEDASAIEDQLLICLNGTTERVLGDSLRELRPLGDEFIEVLEEELQAGDPIQVIAAGPALANLPMDALRVHQELLGEELLGLPERLYAL